MKNYNYIYLITNNLNGKIYVGKHSTDNLNDGYMGSGVALHRAYNKYGIENFSKRFLVFVDTVEKLNWFERFYIKKYHARINGYNLTDGGEGVLGRCVAEETKRKISEANKGQIPWSKGKTLSEEHKQKISESLKGEKNPFFGKPSPNKGKPMSEEQKYKISDAKKGKPSPNKGNHHSEETRKKISESLKGNTPWNKGKPMSEEQKRKISETKKGKPSPNKGKPMLEEHKQKIRESLIGKKYTKRKKEAV